MQYSENFGLKEPEYGEKAKVDDLNFNTEKIDTIMGNNRSMIAEYFDQTQSYTAGKVVQLNGKTYRFKVDHAPGNFNPSEVDEEPIGNFIGEGGGSADVTKTASGNPIEITDSASAPLVKCVTEIQGSQDLHGYDKPWVGGAGKNKIKGSVKSETAFGLTIVLNTDGSFNVKGTYNRAGQSCDYYDSSYATTLPAGSYILNGNAENDAGLYLNVRVGSMEYTDAFTLSESSSVQCRLHVPASANGIPLPTNGLTFYPMIRLSTETDPTFAPYSNICPITAYTEGEIEVRGKNILNPNSAISYGTGSSTYSVSGNAINVTTSGQYSGIVFDKELPNGTYNISFSFKFNNSGTASVTVMDEDNTTSLWTTGEFSSDTTRTGNFNVTNGIAHIRFYCTRSNASGNVTISNLMLNTGSSSENYEEFRGTTHTTTFPYAIYRGSEDVVNGSVVCDWIKRVLSSTDNFNRFAGDSQTTVFKFSNFDIADTSLGEISNILVYNPNAWDPSRHLDYAFIVGNNELYVSIPTSVASDNSEFATWLTNNTVEIAYKKMTPTTSSVTPTNLPIKSLSGYTHIESSTGDMDVEYITEEYQPIVDLIQSNKHVYSTAEQIVGTWIDGSTIYEKTVSFTVPSNDYETEATGITNYGKCVGYSGIVEYSNGMVEDINYSRHDSSLSTFYVVILADGNIFFKTYESVDATAYITIRYTKTTPTRSLNLTKSAVTENDSKDELPDEIKNAPFEEKPDYNEADDDAPTEVDER